MIRPSDADGAIASALLDEEAAAALLRQTMASIGPLDATAMAAAAARQACLTKPPGSLGRLEALSVQLAGIQGQAPPAVPRKAILTLAADHGVAAEGVSAYPQSVTAQMVANFLAGGAAINVLARLAGARLVIADMGLAGDASEGVAGLRPAAPDVRLVSLRLAPGTANLACEPAMSRGLTLRAIAAGIDLLTVEAQHGLDAVGIGEMGIANTTPASCLAAALTGASPDEVTGGGTGLDAAGLARKRSVIAGALARHGLLPPGPVEPLDALARVGGLEIAGLAGVILGAAARRLPVVLDGFIAGAAALVAARLAPTVLPYCIAAHRSAEPGHRYILEALALEPLLDLELRLGEGTGAALALPLLEAACRTLAEMATFESAGVSTAGEAGPVAPDG